MARSFRRMHVGDVPAVFEVRLATVENAVTADELEHGMAAQQQASAQQPCDARLARQRDGYNRLLGACMQGRGYGAG